MLGAIAKAIVGSVLGQGLDMLKGWLDTRRKIDEIKAESAVKIEQARQEAEIKRLTADIDWEAEMARQAENSWKDEYWTVILSVPLILIFFPWTQGYIITGFDALKAVPEWYLWAVGIAIGAAFGVSRFKDALTHWRNK